MNITTANFFVKKKTHWMHIIHMQFCCTFSTIYTELYHLSSWNGLDGMTIHTCVTPLSTVAIGIKGSNE